MNKYEVEFKSTTYRTYIVNAPNRKFAEEFAVEELQMDTDVSSAWFENAQVGSIGELNDDKPATGCDYGIGG